MKPRIATLIILGVFLLFFVLGAINAFSQGVEPSGPIVPYQPPIEYRFLAKYNTVSFYSKGTLIIHVETIDTVTYNYMIIKQPRFKTPITPVDPAPLAVSIPAVPVVASTGVSIYTDYFGGSDPNDQVTYAINIKGYKSIEAEYTRGETNPIKGSAEIHAETATGKLIGKLEFKNTTSWNTKLIERVNPENLDTSVATTKIVIVFKGGDGNGNFYRWTFKP